MSIKVEKITITTDAAGDTTVYSGDFVGLLHELIYVPGTLATGADLTITDDVTGAAIITITNGGTAAVRLAPRVPTVDATNAASLYADTGEPVNDRMAIVGRLKVVVAEGGNAKTGTLYIVWER